MPRLTLKDALPDWTDADVAAYQLAMCLGLMSPDVDTFWGKAKHVFWSNHSIGQMLYTMLNDLADNQILEKRDEPDYQYRWNVAYKGSWE